MFFAAIEDYNERIQFGVFCKPFFAHTHLCLVLLRPRKFASLLSLLLYIECKLSV
jgi:hypothetical protein